MSQVTTDGGSRRGGAKGMTWEGTKHIRHGEFAKGRVGLTPGGPADM